MAFAANFLMTLSAMVMFLMRVLNAPDCTIASRASVSSACDVSYSIHVATRSVSRSIVLDRGDSLETASSMCLYTPSVNSAALPSCV
eukprot:25910-Eustigmatos_ZCMA.PRE.1